MAARITGDVLDSYVLCKYKGYLKLLGQLGAKSDYETLLAAIRSEVRLNAIDKLRIQNQGSRVVSDVLLTTSALERGAPFLLDATMEDDLLSFSFEGLKKVPGASKLG